MNNHNEEQKTQVIAPRRDYPLIESQQTMRRALALIDENLGNQKFSILNLSRIRVPSGGALEFRVETASGIENHRTLTVVITAYRMARAYWRKPYGTGKGKQPPDCSSKDGFIGEGDPGGDCAECPLAAFGTAQLPDGSQGAGQACKELRQLLVLLPGQMLPHLLNIPPTSLQNFTKYSMNLVSAGTAYWGCTTKMTLEPAISTGGVDYARINFTLLKPLADQQTANLEPYHQRMRAFLTPMTVDTTAYEIVEPEAEAGRQLTLEEAGTPLAENEPGPEGRNPDDAPF